MMRQKTDFVCYNGVIFLCAAGSFIGLNCFPHQPPLQKRNSKHVNHAILIPVRRTAVDPLRSPSTQS